MRKPNEKHPLAGTRILVGRARHQAGSLSASLRGLGAAVIEIPFIEIRKPQSYGPLDDALRNIKAYDWLILTSVNGVEAMWQRVRKLRITRRKLKHLQIAAIGPATKMALVKHGLKVKMVPEEYVAESVVKGLRDKVSGKRVVVIRAKVARDVIPEELRAAGAEVDVLEAYETMVPEKSQGWLKHVQFASIGPVTSATLRKLQLPVAFEAREFTMGGLIRAIVLARYAEPR
jgi:uroporphyrinogen-III synthase